MVKNYPIIYVRGYAMTQSEVESTFNMPYYGFNLGSTQFKLTAGTKPKMHIFESPVVRLLKEEGYQDSFGRFVTLSCAISRVEACACCSTSGAEFRQ